MRQLRRLVLSATCATVLAAGIVFTPTTAYAAGPPAQAELSYACGQLADAITYLQSLPAGPVRDALLARAQWAYASYGS
jgi:hypothetical protein